MLFTALNDFVKHLVTTKEVSFAQPPIPHMDLVFDTGGFNGGFGAGVALYLHALQQSGQLTIGRVSGCSAGAFVAVWLLSGCPLSALRHVDTMYNHYRQHLNLAVYKDIVKKFLKEIFPSKHDVTKLDNRLYINYYDTVTGKQCVVTHFKNRKHLQQCIVRSSHIPYITNGKACAKGRYIDGMVPYIFLSPDLPSTKNSSSQTLFIRLVTLSKLRRVFSIKSETNAEFRLLAGVADAHEFFTTGSSDMCCFVADWNILHHLHIKLRLLTCLICFRVLEWLRWRTMSLSTTWLNACFKKCCRALALHMLV